MANFQTILRLNLNWLLKSVQSLAMSVQSVKSVQSKSVQSKLFYPYYYFSFLKTLFGGTVGVGVCGSRQNLAMNFFHVKESKKVALWHL